MKSDEIHDEIHFIIHERYLGKFRDWTKEIEKRFNVKTDEVKTMFLELYPKYKSIIKTKKAVHNHYENKQQRK
jgi:hypothetical protein